jgi:hypothetical protein
MSNVLGLVVEFGIRTALWLYRSKDAIGDEENGRISIKYYVFFISEFLMRSLGMYYAKI